MRLRRILYGLFVLICLAALTLPGYAGIGNRIEPLVLGLPPSLAWNVGWVVASFFALLAFDLGQKEDESAKEDRQEPEGGEEEREP